MSTVTTAPLETGTVVEQQTLKERLAGLAQRHGALAVLVLVVAVASAASPGFATADNLGAVGVGSAYTSLLALGMTFVIISGGIDLSVGSVFALGGVLAAWGSIHGGVVLALVLPVVVCGAFGLVQGLLIGRVGLAAFIVTLAGMLGARGLLLALTHEGQQTYLVPAGSAFAQLGAGTLVPILTALVFFAVGVVVLQRTGFGQALFAIGGNEQAATLMGLPVLRTKVLVYVQSGLLAGIAGALNASRLQSGVTTAGVGYELVAIAAVVIGGTLLTGGAGSVTGTLVGVALLAVIQNLIGHYISQYGSAASDAVNGGFLALVVLLQTYLARLQRVG
jgi:galactofuranose transport system permease protein